MCGRFTMFIPPEDVARIFHLSLDEVRRIFDFPPRYNVAPTDPVAAVRLRSGDVGREPARLRWGLVPHWARSSEMVARTINARAESVADKPAFRDSFRQRRCLVLTNGFYEWRKLSSGKQPYFICMRGREPFAFAGLWDRWIGGGRDLESCAIVTTRANRTVQPIHDRMPVILQPQDYDMWLTGTAGNREALLNLLRPFPDDQLTAYPVSTLVNKPTNDLPACVEPAEPRHPELFDAT